MNLSDYLRTSQAAEFLGVSPGTVRNWEKQGKLRAHKLPQNGYRLFLKADLEAVLREVQDSVAETTNPSPPSRKRKA